MADLGDTHSAAWRVVSSGYGGYGVSPRSPLLCSTLVGGGVCLCSCDCVWSSVAVFMASQDVEVTVSCRVVCRPALQHHHPTTNKTQDAFYIQKENYSKKTEDDLTFDPRPKAAPACFRSLCVRRRNIAEIFCSNIHRSRHQLRMWSSL